MDRKLTAEEEQDLGRAIRAAEKVAREAIAGIDAAERIIRRGGSRSERTRAGAVDRLVEAVAACAELAREEPELAERVHLARRKLHEAERLRWSLAMSGLRIARGEARKLASSMMAEEDLVQEGQIGLMRAAKRFDPDRGIRFSTYARWWVRAQMTRALENGGRMVRLPGGAVEQIRNLQKAAIRFRRAGLEYDTDDLAREVGIDKARAELLLSQGGVLSLEQEDDDGMTILDRLEAEGRDAEPEVAVLTKRALGRLVGTFDDVLDAREKFVLVNHYGLDGHDAQSMTRIGRTLGLSRERVRQIKVGALERLRDVVL